MTHIVNIPTFSQNVKQVKANYSKDSDASTSQSISAADDERNQLKKTNTSYVSTKQQNNDAIIKANLSVSVGAGNEPLSLLFKTAIEGINDVLKPEFGDNAVQSVYDSELDISPDATADRIVSMSTAFFSQYQKQNSEMSTEEAAESFAKIITGGIDKGFSEARDILSGLNVLENDISDNVDTTYDLVQKGLQAFVDSYITSEKET